MAGNPISIPLPADLPEAWTEGQTIAPNGPDVGLQEQYGYNYLMRQVNNAQKAVKEIAESGVEFEDAVTVPGGGEIAMGAGIGAGPYTLFYDGEEGAAQASEVGYDNSASGLVGGTVQAALDELAQGMKSGSVAPVEAAAPAAGWAGSPPSQTIAVPGMGPDTVFWVGLADSATQAQRAAARKAVLAPTGQSAGELTLTADGTAPTLDLPILILLSGGES